MQKAKEYDWKDSNVALIGSDTDREVKKESAQTEPAWNGIIQAGPGLHIWRINKFKVEHWPKEEYGKFYNGDSYIILNIYKSPDSDALLYDVHFWIGKYSTQDEYGTAAYKTVELDTLLDDRPIQHREVMNNESDLFKSYFQSIILMKGGADTGFRHVKTKEYKPRLLHVSGESKNTVVMNEVPMKKGNVNDEDVFIIDSGSKIFQYNGPKSSKDEKYKGGQEVSKLRSERNGIPSEIIDSLDELPDDIKNLFAEGQSKKKVKPQATDVQLAKVSDESGSITMETIATGQVSRDMMNNDDVFIVYNGVIALVLIGDNASTNEKKNAMAYATKFLQDKPNPLVPITTLRMHDIGHNADAMRIFA